MVGASLAANKDAGGKSGLRKLNPGDILFNDGDHAQSLYIIQKGQLRLYKPKGRGFIEIAVLRAGEVLGEMAYFDEDGSGNKRSCSASAMTPTEVIEISFVAFSKTMAGLNPWFKTIINTLATRLRKANGRIRELESNSVSHGYGGKASTYEFFRSIDIVRGFSVLFLVTKAHGEQTAEGMAIHKNTMGFYAFDIFNVMEVKFDQLIEILVENELMSIAPDEEGNNKVIVIPDLEKIRSLLIFFNTQRVAPEEKKLSISDRCETFLDKILDQLDAAGVKTPQTVCDMSTILDGFKAVKENIDLPDLEDARKAGFVGEVIVGEGNKLTCPIQYARLKGTMPSIRIQNAIKRFNETQSGV